MNILIAEDETDIRKLVKIHLEDRSYRVFEAKDGIEALEVVNQHEINLAILDIVMPKLDGLNLLRQIREKSHIPVILLTARGEEFDKIVGLGLGADDYMVKPFSASELVARVEAQLRRRNVYDLSQSITEETIQHRELKLNLKDCMLYINESPVLLNAKEYKVLQCLMQSPNQIFTPKKLYAAAWEEDFYSDNNTIMVTISRLRNKIERDPHHPEYIVTVRGLGYKFYNPGK
ncbi:DNA-binding response regulator [Paenibacillus odorifer]|uniref:response regulator transcription factor n=1 Tax=Paenibacillus odorifer TaxID=189426 RepID=UPI00096E89C6|nr:response regulator transcription factor [Paenibacillus odorifer]OMC72692.1 DNA-binding response regulator [Paenibacillus odorifer]